MLKLLDTLETIVTGQIITNQTNPSVETFEECLSIARSEQEKIKKNLLGLVITISNEQSTCLFIKHFQSKLIDLSNLLYKHINTAPELLSFPQSKSDISEFAKISMLQLIDELLSHSQVHFSQFIDPSFQIPNHIRDVAIKQFQCFIDDLFVLKKCLPDTLIEIITEPLYRFTNDPKAASIENLNYLKHFTADLLNILISIEEEKLINTIKTKLFYLNLNTLAFFHYLADEVQESLNKIESVSERIEKLCWYLKKVNQTPVGTRFVFIPGQKAINEVFSQWLIEEIAYHEKSIQLAILNKEELKSLAGHNFKIDTDLSVAQFAFLLRVLVEIGVFKNQNDLELTRFFASNTKSKRTDNISPESLRTKFYSLDYQLSEDIKEIAIKMLNYIQKLQ